MLNWPMTDDRAWIRGIRDGEPETLCAVYTAYKDELLSLALVLARDRTLAEDVLQDVFVELARKGCFMAAPSPIFLSSFF